MKKGIQRKEPEPDGEIAEQDTTDDQGLHDALHTGEDISGIHEHELIDEEMISKIFR